MLFGFRRIAFIHFRYSDTVLNDLVRRVFDEVSEHNINDSARF